MLLTIKNVGSISGEYNGLQLAIGTTGDAFLIQNENINLRINVNGNEAMRIDSNRNVGIDNALFKIL